MSKAALRISEEKLCVAQVFLKFSGIAGPLKKSSHSADPLFKTISNRGPQLKSKQTRPSLRLCENSLQNYNFPSTIDNKTKTRKP